jgi:hypothetical protein
MKLVVTGTQFKDLMKYINENVKFKKIRWQSKKNTLSFVNYKKRTIFVM